MEHKNETDLAAQAEQAETPCQSDVTEQSETAGQLGRRGFLKSVAITSAGLALPSTVMAATKAPVHPVRKTPVAPVPKPQEVRVAMIGAGTEGRNLLVDCLLIPGIRFVAVADIWPYSQQYASGILRKYGQPINTYTDYQDMLEKEKGIDAVIIATPDWMHSEHTVACLKAGKHVYCEKEMSNTIEGARAMVQAARDTGKLLQIGHQRRSNPRYLHALKLIEHDKICGRMTHTFGQWNRAHGLLLGWPKNRELDAATLTKYGYDTMDRFRNWRWYKKFAGGPFADLGSHQVDIFNWFLRTNPTGVMATGTSDYYPGREWPDSIQCLFEWQTAQGQVTGMYQVLNTTSYGGYYEVFEGDAGSIQISEDTNIGAILPEPNAPRKEWLDDAKNIEKMGKEAILLTVGATLGATGKKAAEARKLVADSQKPPHMPHLENFFGAVRSGTPLNCPSEVGFETCVSVLRVNDAVASGTKISFTPDDFKA